MRELDKKIYEFGLVPVVVIDDENDAVPLAKALIDGGLPLAEVTFRTAAAKGAIEKISKTYPDMLVGAGTVLTTTQVDEATNAGAKFIVAPGFDETVVKYCLDKNIPIFPGIATASELAKAVSMGLQVVKFFPAEDLGGLKMIKAISAAYTKVKFMPTGGLNQDNMVDYLKSDKIFACGGSFMVKKDFIKNKEFDKITKITMDAIKKVHGFKVVHIGINNEDKDVSEKGTDTICEIFDFDKDVRSASFFAGPSLEFMNKMGKGTKGHIAIGCNNVDRAVAYLASKGILFDMSTAQYKEDGSMKFIYLEGEYSGFAYHLVLNK